MPQQPDTSTDLYDACYWYLSRKGIVLWGTAFEIVSPSGRAQAARWLANEVANVNTRVIRAVEESTAYDPFGVLREKGPA